MDRSHPCARLNIQETSVSEGFFPLQKITHTPLLFLFLDHSWAKQIEELSQQVSYDPFILFFGRVEKYKGLNYLLAAWNQINTVEAAKWRLVIAGKGPLETIVTEPLTENVELHNYFIKDSEALDFFQHCSLVILPYTGATQSSLIAAAYFFRKPVIVTQSGALPEYVKAQKTGWVVPAKNVEALVGSIKQALLLPQTQLQELGENGRAWYDSQRLSEEKMLHAMYNHVAHNR